MNAWRYLFPGVLAMLLFVAFPLVYTVQIGFTNYSASNLLSEDRARGYLLEQAEVSESRAYGFSLHPDGDDRARLVLTPQGEGASSTRFASAPLSLGSPQTGAVAMQPLASNEKLSAPYSLRQVVANRDALKALRLTLPDQSQLIYAGLREFAVFEPLWQAQPGGALKRLLDGAVYQPNRDTGYFEDAQGERLQPGFKVGVGFANYARLFGDADMRGPFVSIFIWTVVFAGSDRAVLHCHRHDAGSGAELGSAEVPHAVPHTAVPALCGAGLHFDTGIQGIVQPELW
jgi:maltose/maltodextrin transport system permease protein